MPQTQNRAYPYPPKSTPPGIGWLDIENLAKAVDADVAALALSILALPRGIIARGRRGSDKTTITTEVGVLRLDDVPIFTGRLYRVTAQFSVNNVTVRVLPMLRYTTDGSTPTTSSTVLEETVFNSVAVTSTGGTARAEGLYTPGSNETLSVLLTAQSSGAALTVFGTNAEHCDLVIEDCGIDPGDTGTDV